MTAPSPQSSSSAVSVLVAAAAGGGMFVLVIALIVTWRSRKRHRIDNEVDYISNLLSTQGARFKQLHGSAVDDENVFDLQFRSLSCSLPPPSRLGSKQRRGRFGQVYHAEVTPDQLHGFQAGDSVSVSIECLETADTSLAREFVFQCYVYHLLASHPHVRRLLAMDWMAHPVKRAFANSAGGRLSAYVRIHPRARGDATAVLCCIASGMSYLESLDIVHGRLSGWAVFVGEGPHDVCIGDMHACKETEHDNHDNHTEEPRHRLRLGSQSWTHQVKDGQGSEAWYVAPEARKKALPTSAAASAVDISIAGDVYSFGRIAQFILGWTCASTSKRTAYAAEESAIQSLADKCCVLDPEQRPSFRACHKGLIHVRDGRADATATAVSAADVTVVAKLDVQQEVSGLACTQVLCKGEEMVLTCPSWQQEEDTWALTLGVYEHQWQGQAGLLPATHVVDLANLTEAAASSQNRTGRRGVLVFPWQPLAASPSVSGANIALGVLRGLDHLFARGLWVCGLDVSHVVVYDSCVSVVAMPLERIRDNEMNGSEVAQYFKLMKSCLLHWQGHACRKELEAVLSLENQHPTSRWTLGSLLRAVEDVCGASSAVRWEVSWSELKLVRYLGSGAFGEVSLMSLSKGVQSPNWEGGTHVNSAGERLVAVKVLQDENGHAEFEQELEMMQSLRHPHLVRLLHVVADSQKLTMIISKSKQTLLKIFGVLQYELFWKDFLFELLYKFWRLRRSLFPSLIFEGKPAVHLLASKALLFSL